MAHFNESGLEMAIMELFEHEGYFLYYLSYKSNKINSYISYFRSYYIDFQSPVSCL